MTVFNHNGTNKDVNKDVELQFLCPLFEVTTVKSSKKKRAKKLKLLPGQKLLTDMMVKEKAEDTLKNDGQ